MRPVPNPVKHLPRSFPPQGRYCPFNAQASLGQCDRWPAGLPLLFRVRGVGLMPPADSKLAPKVFRQKGWQKVGDGPWEPEPGATHARAVTSANLDVPDRTNGELLDEVLRLTNRQLAGLSSIAEDGMLNDLELTQLGRVHQIVLAQMRVKPSEDPMNQRDGETDEAYLERLENMKRSAK